jgi:hypothetical protein
VRTTDPSVIEKYKSILINLSDKPTGDDTKKNLLRILFRMIGHTRDIESGKGEYKKEKAKSKRHKNKSFL